MVIYLLFELYLIGMIYIINVRFVVWGIWDVYFDYMVKLIFIGIIYLNNNNMVVIIFIIGIYFKFNIYSMFYF